MTAPPDKSLPLDPEGVEAAARALMETHYRTNVVCVLPEAFDALAASLMALDPAHSGPAEPDALEELREENEAAVWMMAKYEEKWEAVRRVIEQVRIYRTVGAEAPGTSALWRELDAYEAHSGPAEGGR